MSQAYTIMQTAGGKVRHVETASEIIGAVSLSNNAEAIGDVQEFVLNPSVFRGTRLAQLSSIFQKYKFTKAELVIDTNQPTTVGGQFAIGYTNQPEQEFPPGATVIQEVFALPNAKLVQTYVPIATSAKIDEKQPLLFIDDEGNEKNTTEQGKFVITTAAPTTAASIQTFQAILNYTCVFEDAAVVRTVAQPTLAWPSFYFSARNATTWAMNAVPVSGETLTYPAINANVLYALDPQLEFQLRVGNMDVGSEKVMFVAYAGVTDNYFFYKSEEDYKQGNPVRNIGIISETDAPNKRIPRSTITLVGN